MKKFLSLLIFLCGSALYGIKKGDMLVSIPYKKGSSVVSELVKLQKNFDFRSKPRDYQFHTTVAYVEGVYKGEYKKGWTSVPEGISEALMGRKRWEDGSESNFAPIKEICGLTLGDLALFGNHVVVRLAGRGVDEFVRLHDNVAEMCSNRSEECNVSQEHADYIPHISLGQIDAAQEEDVKGIIDGLNRGRARVADFCVDTVRLSFENKSADKPLDSCHFDL